MTDMSEFLETILNLSKYHREHEKFYAKSPLECAIQLQKASGILKTLADRWEKVQAENPKEANPFMGCEDLNETASIQ